MAEETNNHVVPTLTKHQRYYALHKKEKNAKTLERYHNRPDIIAKREERERKKTEKDSEREVKRIEREKRQQERLALAIATRKTSTASITPFLVSEQTSPVGDISKK